MLKHTFTALILLFACQFGFSQDLIVTKSNDSINCKITKVKNDQIYFLYQKDEAVESTLIPLKNVSSYKFKFYEEVAISKEEIPGFNKFSGFRIAVNGGYSYDPGRDYNTGSSTFNDYYNQLRSGFHLETDARYFFDELIGVGVRFSYFNASNELYDVFEDPEQAYSDNIKVSYVGPQFSFRFLNKSKKNAFLLTSSIGYLSYKNDQDYSNPIEITGSALGLVSEVGYDIGIADNWSMGIQLGITSGFIKKLTYDDGVSTQEIELPKNNRPQGSARIDFGIGIRYYP